MRSYLLIIEIDDGLRRSIEELFLSEGIEVVVEADSGRGVARIMQRSPGAVLMADNMPPLDGVELLPLARRLTTSPIIVVGEGGETAVVRALLQGADMYLRKPVNYLELLSRVHALLRRSEPDPYRHPPETNFAAYQDIPRSSVRRYLMKARSGLRTRLMGGMHGLPWIPWEQVLDMGQPFWQAGPWATQGLGSSWPLVNPMCRYSKLQATLGHFERSEVSGGWGLELNP